MAETIGDALDLSWRIVTRCAASKRREGLKSMRDCIFRAELDTETLVCTRGRAFPLAKLDTRLRCPGCGSRQMAVFFQPPSSPMRATGS